MNADLSRLSGRYRRIPDTLFVRAKELRRQQTSTEKLLWMFLRGRRLKGAKFRRLHNIGPYIADFYCHQAVLAVELDGPIHQTRKVQDEARDAWMKACGFTILRFDNVVVWNCLDEVLLEMCSYLPDEDAG
ncbi:MAG: DUF559 domain-containing protein [Cyanobacteria bacterium J06627_32]